MAKQKSAVNRILIIQLVIMIIIMLIVTTFVSYTTRNNSLDHLATVTEDRAQIVSNYVDNAEKTLTAYSRASQIINLLKDPSSTVNKKVAQKYTEEFSKDIPFLEGIYASEWNTHVLTHTNSKIIGMTTRTDPALLQQLQDAMLAAGSGVYDTGIIISPASGKQIVSMYKAVYDDNGTTPIGLVGIGIFTDGLIANLNELNTRELANSQYSMVDVDTHKIIFHTNQYMIQQETDNELRASV